MQSSQADITQQNPQQYLVSGVVDFSTAPDLLRKSLVFFSALNASGNRRITIDLSSVEECNSAALALILEVSKSAKQKNIDVHFENLPLSLLTIAKAYGVENEIRELCK